MRLIASASNDATESTFNLAHRRSLPLSGIVLVTTTSSNLDAFKRSRACPERTGCVQADQTRRAPCSRQAGAPWVIVPAVSIMSSSSRASRPATSPMMCMTWDSLGPSRRLSMIARLACNRLAKARARSTPPASGETTTRPCCPRFPTYSSNTGDAYRWSTGMLKNPWICPACRSIVSTRSAPAVRSEEHTSELQSLAYLVCRLLLEKKYNNSVIQILASFVQLREDVKQPRREEGQERARH